MAFTSTLYPGEKILHNFGHADAECPPDQSKGYKARDFDANPVGCRKAAPEFDLELLSDDEIKREAELRETTKTRISDRIIAAELPPKNQSNTSNCWANGPVGAGECLRCIQGLPYVELSPAFIATTLREYNGGMGLDALEVMVEKGVPSCDLFPANANGHKIDQPILDSAAKHKILEWRDIGRDKLRAVATAILKLDAPCPVGYDGWGHEIYAVDVFIDSDGNICLRIRNSWGDWSFRGFAVLSHRITVPDDACCPYVAEASLT